MRNLKNLNVNQSIKCKKLIYTESWFDKIDAFVVYLFFLWGLVLPFFIFFNPYRDYSETGIEYYLAFIFSFFCLYVIYRKATEKKLIEIKSSFDLVKNRELINKYCQEKGYEKYRNSDNIIIYNVENPYSLNSNYKTSRIFLLDNNSIFISMLKTNYKLNIPILFSHFILKKDIEGIVKK